MRSQHSSDEISNDAMECRDSHTSESEQRQNNQRNNCASSLLDLLRSSASRQSKMLPSSISVQCKQYNETCGLLDRLETSFSSTNNTSQHDKQIDESEHQSANERAVRSFLSFIETRHLDLDYILARLNGCRDGIAVHPLPLCEVQKQAADITQQHTTISVSRIVRKEDTKNLDDSIEDASIAITEISTSSSYEQSSNGSEAPILSTLVSSAVAATAESQPQDRPPHNDNIPLKDDPTYSIYFRMLRYGFTMGAVRAALERDGMVDITRLDPEISVCEQLNEGEGDLNGGEVTDEDDSDGVARVPSESRLLANNPSLKRTQSTGGIPSWLKPQANRGILEGWLRKRTRRGIWVRRWYLLDSTGIYYSHSPPFSAEASGNAASSYRRSNSSSSKLIKLADARYLTIQRWSDNPLVFELRESTQSESIVALRAQSNVEVMLWEASIASFSENQRFLDEVVVSSGRIQNMVEKHRPSVEDEVDGNVEVTLDEYDYTDSALEENNNNEDETLSDPLEEPLENDNLADITNSRIESIAGNKGDETSTNAKLEEATEQQHVTTYIEQNDDGEQTIEENSPITDNRAAVEPAPRSALTTMLNKRAATSSADGKADNFVTSMANDEAVDDETQADPRTALTAMLNKRAASSDDDKAEDDDEAVDDKAPANPDDDKSQDVATSTLCDGAVDDEASADPRRTLMAMLNKRAASSDDDKAEGDDEEVDDKAPANPRTTLMAMLNKCVASSDDDKAEVVATSTLNDGAVDDEASADPKKTLMAMLNKRASSSDEKKAEEGVVTPKSSVKGTNVEAQTVAPRAAMISMLNKRSPPSSDKEKPAAKTKATSSRDNNGNTDSMDAIEDGDSPALKDDLTYQKYFKMLKMGLPLGAVKNALQRDGLDPAILDLDPNKSVGSQTKKEEVDDSPALKDDPA